MLRLTPLGVYMEGEEDLVPPIASPLHLENAPGVADWDDGMDESHQIVQAG